jgi:hypothetical protein
LFFSILLKASNAADNVASEGSTSLSIRALKVLAIADAYSSPLSDPSDIRSLISSNRYSASPSNSSTFSVRGTEVKAEKISSVFSGSAPAAIAASLALVAAVKRSEVDKLALAMFRVSAADAFEA